MKALKVKDLNKRFSSTDLYSIYALIYVYTRVNDSEDKFEIAFELDQLREKILYELENICLRELRHLGGYCWIWSRKEDPIISSDLTKELRKKINKFLKGIYGKEISNGWDDLEMGKNAKMVIPTYFREFLTFEEANKKLKKDIFNWEIVISLLGNDPIMSKYWDPAYAGDAWVKFAQSCMALEKAKYNELWYRIDRTINLCHNGNMPFLDKFFYRNGLLNAADDLSDESMAIEEVYSKANENISDLCKKIIRKNEYAYA